MGSARNVCRLWQHRQRLRFLRLNNGFADPGAALSVASQYPPYTPTRSQREQFGPAFRGSGRCRKARLDHTVGPLITWLEVLL